MESLARPRLSSTTRSRPVLADGQDVHGSGVGRVLLARRLAVLLVDVVLLTQGGAAPVVDQEVFELLFHLEGQLVLHLGGEHLNDGSPGR